MFFEPHPEHYQKVEKTQVDSPMRISAVQQDALLAAAAEDAGVRSARLETPSMKTIGLTVHQVSAHKTTQLRRDAASRMMAVVEGGGHMQVGDSSFDCQRGDVIAVPIWTPFQFSAGANTRLLEVSDEPVQRVLGFYRKEETT